MARRGPLEQCRCAVAAVESSLKNESKATCTKRRSDVGRPFRTADECHRWRRFIKSAHHPLERHCVRAVRRSQLRGGSPRGPRRVTRCRFRGTIRGETHWVIESAIIVLQDAPEPAGGRPMDLVGRVKASQKRRNQSGQNTEMSHRNAVSPYFSRCLRDDHGAASGRFALVDRCDRGSIRRTVRRAFIHCECEDGGGN